MRMIFSPVADTIAVCGVQKKRNDTQYRFSAYALRVKCEDGMILYNTLTGCMFLLETTEANFCDANLNDAQPLTALSDDNSIIDRLIENWYLVPVEFDEQRHAREIRQVFRLLKKEKPYVNDFTIFTTTDCNARCFYCYEKGIERETMTVDTAHEVAAYIAKSCKGNGVKITWFGGEPLLNIPAIDIIAEDLSKYDIDYYSVITSNAYYLDKDIAARAKENWNLTRALITLDGTREVYNRTKSYINHSSLINGNDDPFTRVLGNIQNALETGIGVTIRLNMDQQNAEDLSDLCDVIYDRFGNQDGLECTLVLLKDWGGFIHEFESDDETIKIFNRLRNKLLEYDLVKTPPLNRFIPVNHCMADNDASETILPDGRIGKCDQYQGEDLIGSIFTDKRDVEMIKAWKEPVEFPECKECVLYPGCFNLKKCNWYSGGCTELHRTLHINRLKRQVLNEYNAVTGKKDRI